MHDRRINGETFVFGNAGGLYMNAMTWWDHQTYSVWSQPVGEVIFGEMAGARLDLLPTQLTTWANWVANHPQTFVMSNDLDLTGSIRKQFNPDFVIGVLIEELALAFYYEEVEAAGFVQAAIGDWPVLVWAADEDYRVYLRQVGAQTLTFSSQDGGVYDDQTHSRWDLALGLALEGPLQGQALQQLPSLTSFDWAWLDFYPLSGIYGE